MNTAVINIKTDPKVKHRAHQVAEELGLSLSAVLSALLKQFIRTKTIHVSMEPLTEIPTVYLQNILKASTHQQIKELSPTLHSAPEAIRWLRKKHGSKGSIQ